MKLGIRPSLSARAFTILEVLVALFIFSMVLTSLYATWRLVLQSNAVGLKLAADAQRARLAMQTVEEAIGSAVRFNSNTNYDFEVDTSGTFAEVRNLAAHLSDSFPGGGYFEGERVRKIRFAVENGPDGTPALFMKQVSLLADERDESAGFPVLLAKEITLFTLEFWDSRKHEFMPEWRTPKQLPQLVRITLGFGVRKSAQSEPNELVTRVVRLTGIGVDGALQGGPPSPAPTN
jgi:prepilin-type N-terminal cleavage/methylation domain-containing protein